MLVIDVCVDPEEPFEDGFGDLEEILGEGDADLGGEERLLVELVLDPGHEVVDVLGGRALDGFLDGVAVGPVVLVLGPRRHDWTPLLRAELCDGAVEHIDLVEEVHRVDGHPLVQVLPLWQHHCQSQVAYNDLSVISNIGIVLNPISSNLSRVWPLHVS